MTGDDLYPSFMVIWEIGHHWLYHSTLFLNDTWCPMGKRSNNMNVVNLTLSGNLLQFAIANGPVEIVSFAISMVDLSIV